MSQPSPFVWFDLCTADEPAAVAFYTAVTGWKTESWEGGSYTMWVAADGTAVGGIDAANGAPAHWLAYLAVADLDTAVGMVRVLGGKVLREPFAIAGVGRAAVIADPAGASLALFQPDDGSAPEPDEPSPVGRFAWTELATTEPEQSVRFWFRLMGWTDADTVRLPSGRYLIFGAKRGDRGFGGMQASADGSSHWLYYVTVADLEAALGRVVELGGQAGQVMTVMNGERVAHCVDPEGARFALHAYP
ncbi:MAG: VOC family protein [Deltaproteobacteria bacterium]|nr:MAG: VOC family protein [Deltaproteobacteria bacterium]